MSAKAWKRRRHDGPGHLALKSVRRLYPVRSDWIKGRKP